HPKIEPPALGADAHHKEKQQTHGRQEKDHDEFVLAPIDKPRTPALHGLLVMQRKRMPSDVHRQVAKLESKHQHRQKDHSLQKAVSRTADSEDAEACDPGKSQSE